MIRTQLSKKHTLKIKIIVLLILVLPFLVHISFASSDEGASDSDGQGGTLDLNPYDEESNIGYDNYLLNLYQTGQINTPPPFGGQVQEYIACKLYGVRFIKVGPPRPGWYLWVPGITRTYPYGPPYRVGQYVLGLYTPKYFCVASIHPFLPIEGIAITMMGSSR